MSIDKQRLSYDKVVQAVLGRAKRTKSDQVSQGELAIILSELARVLGRQIAGAVVELGCYRGATSLMMAQLMSWHQLSGFTCMIHLPDYRARPSATDRL